MAVKQLKEKEWLEKICDIRMAIVEVMPGETEEKAWRRHLKEHPEDACANIRVFNHPPLETVCNF
jgi:hypothetical protein